MNSSSNHKQKSIEKNNNIGLKEIFSKIKSMVTEVNSKMVPLTL